MAYLNLRGVDHYYEWITEASSEVEKPVMVFLHGWGGSGRYWRSTARALCDRFDCLLYDMRGFGRSRLPEKSQLEAALDYELETYADDLAALLDALVGDRQSSQVYLNAHSMGASIATLFINRYPERVNRAILTCSGIFDYDERSFTAFHQISRWVVQFRPQWLASVPWVDRLFMARFLNKTIPSHESQAFLADFLMADFEAALGTVLTSVSKQAAETMPGEFAQIRVPTLLVAGERDIIIPAAMGRKAVEQNKKGMVQYLEIAETAHFPMLEDASTYLQGIAPFLAN